MKRLTLLSCVLSTLAVCAATPPTPQAPVSRAEPSPAPQTPQTPTCPEGTSGLSLGTLAEHPSSELVQSRGTGVEAYRLESGVWLANAPILVNEDFDFATAMALGPVGSGLASGKRKKDNEQRAIELASLTLPSEAVAELERLRQCGMHRWGLLWGGAKPSLLIGARASTRAARDVAAATSEYGNSDSHDEASIRARGVARLLAHRLVPVPVAPTAVVRSRHEARLDGPFRFARGQRGLDSASRRGIEL